MVKLQVEGHVRLPTSDSNVDLELAGAIRDWQQGNYDDALSSLHHFVYLRQGCELEAHYYSSIIYSEMGDDESAYLSGCAAVGVGLDLLPDDFSWDKHTLEWDYPGNQPFLRAYKNYALLTGHITPLRRLISVDGLDSFGLTVIVPRTWLSEGLFGSLIEYAKARDYLTSYELCYSLGCSLATKGLEQEAAVVLKEAVNRYPEVAQQFLVVMSSDYIPSYEIDTRSAAYHWRDGTSVLDGKAGAINYWACNWLAWSKKPAAKKVLYSVIKSTETD